MNRNRRHCLFALGAIGLLGCTPENTRNKDAIPVLIMPIAPSAVNAPLFIQTFWERSGRFEVRLRFERVDNIEMEPSAEQPFVVAGSFQLLSADKSVLAELVFEEELPRAILGFGLGRFTVSASDIEAVHSARLSFTEGMDVLPRLYRTGTLNVKRDPVFRFLD